MRLPSDLIGGRGGVLPATRFVAGFDELLDQGGVNVEDRVPRLPSKSIGAKVVALSIETADLSSALLGAGGEAVPFRRAEQQRTSDEAAEDCHDGRARLDDGRVEPVGSGGNRASYSGAGVE